MTIDHGRSASPSGYSAEPEPSCTVSAVPVSIPNAARVASLPWRSMETFPRDGSINAVMFYPWKVRTNDPRIQFGQWLDPYGNGGKLCAPWDCDNEPYADAWLPLAELASLSLPASAIEARRAATAETGAVHESAIGAAETPNTGQGTSHG